MNLPPPVEPELSLAYMLVAVTYLTFREPIDAASMTAPYLGIADPKH